MTNLDINANFYGIHPYYDASRLENSPIPPQNAQITRFHLLNSTYRFLTSIVASVCIMGSTTALAVPSDSAKTLRPVISDQAKLFSEAQITELQQVIERAREEGNIAATVVAETTMLRLSPLQRANELDNEYRDQWGQLFPDQPLAEEIDLASSVGPIRSNESQPLPLTFYFARATGEGSQLIAVGGLDVLKSEIGTPETIAIYSEAGSHYAKMINSSEDPSHAFVEMVELFLHAAAARRSDIYREDKPSSNSDFTAIILIVLGLLFTAAVVLVLRKLSGKGRENIIATTLPKLPLKTRLGGRHSGGMTANLSWDPTGKSSSPGDANP